jgi:(p)ppGpp synthase/HD superfamily hydrolase
MSDLVERAKALAHRAHAGQVDKAGRPYIEHVARVAAAVSGDPEAEAVAWLHDVIEDAPLLMPDVDALGNDRVFYAVCDLTRSFDAFTGRELVEGYYEAIRRNPIALRVKLADIADNADEARLALLPKETAERLRRKYAKAREALTVQP